jgi:hypothetical protein
MKSLLEKWMETGQVEESNEEEESQPTPSTESPFKDEAPQTSNVSNVKDAFDDLFNN